MKIKDISKVITGITPSTAKSKYYDNGFFPFITPIEIKNTRFVKKTNRYVSKYALNDYNNKFVNQNDICIDCIGSDMGNVAIVTEKSLTNQQINVLTNIKTNVVNPMYLYYNLSVKKDYLHQIGMNGSTMPIINKSQFENIDIEVHSLPEQQHIVDISAYPILLLLSLLTLDFLLIFLLIH